MDYTQMLGNTNELKCLLAFTQLGYTCSIPYGNSAKYDFIVEIDKKLYKVQCKSSHYVNDHGTIKTDAITFSTVSQTTNTKETTRHRYTSDQIDYFATCFDNQVYIVPVEECSSSKVLRFSPPNNGQLNYNKAEDYTIEKIFGISKVLEESKIRYDERLDLLKENSKKYYCPNCGKQVTREGNLCRDCYNLEHANPNKPDRETLKNLIRTEPFTTIGKLYNISDNMVRKWCKSYNLPYQKGKIKTLDDTTWKTI